MNQELSSAFYRGFLPGRQTTFTFDLFTGYEPGEHCENPTGEPVMTLVIDNGKVAQKFYISEAEFREYYDKFREIADILQYRENQENYNVTD